MPPCLLFDIEWVYEKRAKKIREQLAKQMANPNFVPMNPATHPTQSTNNTIQQLFQSSQMNGPGGNPGVNPFNPPFAHQAPPPGPPTGPGMTFYWSAYQNPWETVPLMSSGTIMTPVFIQGMNPVQSNVSNAPTSSTSVSSNQADRVGEVAAGVAASQTSEDSDPATSDHLDPVALAGPALDDDSEDLPVTELQHGLVPQHNPADFVPQYNPDFAMHYNPANFGPLGPIDLFTPGIPVASYGPMGHFGPAGPGLSTIPPASTQPGYSPMPLQPIFKACVNGPARDATPVHVGPVDPNHFSSGSPDPFEEWRNGEWSEENPPPLPTAEQLAIIDKAIADSKQGKCCGYDWLGKPACGGARPGENDCHDPAHHAEFTEVDAAEEVEAVEAPKKTLLEKVTALVSAITPGQAFFIGTAIGALTFFLAHRQN